MDFVLRKRKIEIMIIIAILIIALTAGCVDAPKQDTTPSTTVTLTLTPISTPIAALTTTTTPIILSGRGYKTTDFFYLPKGFVEFEMVNDGESNSTVWFINNEDRKKELLFYKIGKKGSSVLVETEKSGMYLLKIESVNGNWKITITNSTSTSGKAPLKYIPVLGTQITADMKNKLVVFSGKVFNILSYENILEDIRDGSSRTYEKGLMFSVDGTANYDAPVLVEAPDWAIKGTIIDGVTVEIYGYVNDQWETAKDYYGNNKVQPYISAYRVIVR